MPSLSHAPSLILMFLLSLSATVAEESYTENPGNQ